MDQNPPLATLRDGRLKATIWENHNEKNELYHTVSLAKTYEDRDGKLRDTNSFAAGELLRVNELAREAHGVVLEIRREMALERQNQRNADKQARPEPAHAPSSQEVTPRRFRDRNGPGMER